MLIKYLKDIGITDAFFPPKRYEEYRRINMEYLLKLKGSSQEETENILIHGLQSNVELGKQLVFKELSGIKEGVRLMAKEMADLKKVLDGSQQILHDILESVKSPGAVKAAEYSRQAAQNIMDSLHLNEKRAHRLLSETVTLLKKAVKINDYDYKAHFDLGWLHDYYLHDLKGAEYHYDTAALRSLRKDQHFAVLSLRHLAEVKRILGDKKGALEAVLEASQLDEGRTHEVRYELALNFANTGQTHSAVKELEDLVTKNSIYFLQIASDPVLAGIREIDFMLSRLQAKEVQKSRESINRAWDLFRGRCSFLGEKDLNTIQVQVEKALDYVDQCHYVELSIMANHVADKLQDFYKKCLMDEQKKLWRGKSAEKGLLKGEEKPLEAVGRTIYEKRKFLIAFLAVALSTSFFIALLVASSTKYQRPIIPRGVINDLSYYREPPRFIPIPPQKQRGLFDLSKLNDTTSDKSIQPRERSRSEMDGYGGTNASSGELFDWGNYKKMDSLRDKETPPVQRFSESRRGMMEKQYRNDMQNMSRSDLERFRDMYKDLK